jgi:long-chain fatty acid transport protein
MKKIVSILFIATSAHAGGLAVGEQNAVSAATGGAGAARDDDPGAAWHDPAALADDGGIRLGLSLALAHPSLEAKASDGSWTTDSTGGWQTPPHIDASIARDRWAAGVAVGVPFGGGVTWPATWAGSNESRETQLMDLRVAPFAAWSFGRVRVAAGVHVDTARLQIDKGLDFIDMQGDVKMDMTAHGVGVDASAFVRASDEVGIGLVYRGRTTLDFSGPANFTAPDAFAGKTPDQDAKTTMVMPDQLVLGAHWQRGAIAVLGDIEYTRWSVNQKTIVTFADPATPQAIQDNYWHDTFAVRAGGEWRRGNIVARAGAYYDPSPVPVAYLQPSAPDGTRIAATAGASYRFSRDWAADVFGEQMFILRRDTTSMDTMPASYGGSAVVLGAGLRWMPR